MKRSEGAIKVILKNKKAFFDYHISERYEAGIELTGTEVKSIRAGKANIEDAFCRVTNSDEMVLINMNITQYEQGGYVNHDPIRKRKLLLRKKEIHRLRSKLVERGFTLIPLMLFFKRGWAKLELGIAKGKQKGDKREAIKKKEAQREIDRYR